MIPTPLHRFLFALFWLLGALLLPAPGEASSAIGSSSFRQTAIDPANHWQRAQAAGKLVFGTAADYPPFEFYNSNFELDGFDIALARAIGAALGVEVEFRDYAFDGLLNAVVLGQVDAAIGAISVTPERKQLVDFTNLYYIGNSVALARKDFAHNHLADRLRRPARGRAAWQHLSAVGAAQSRG